MEFPQGEISFGCMMALEIFIQLFELHSDTPTFLSWKTRNHEGLICPEYPAEWSSDGLQNSFFD